MSRGWSYKSGDWWVSCDICSKQTRASEIKKRWDGFLVCPDDFEHRHPQDLIRVRQDRISVPFSRPDPEEIYVAVSYITIYVDDGYVDYDYFVEES